MRVFVGLLRGINVGGHKKVPMAGLRELLGELGFERVESYIQSGNVVFIGRESAAKVESTLEQALARQLGFAVDVIVRTGEQWQGYADGSPFPDAEAERSNLLHLALSKRAFSPTVVTTLRTYAKANERIEVRGDALWIDFVAGVARSKLTPAVLDRVVGSPVTARNWRTVQKLQAMINAAERAE